MPGSAPAMHTDVKPRPPQRPRHHPRRRPRSCGSQAAAPTTATHTGSRRTPARTAPTGTSGTPHRPAPARTPRTSPSHTAPHAAPGDSDSTTYIAIATVCAHPVISNARPTPIRTTSHPPRVMPASVAPSENGPVPAIAALSNPRRPVERRRHDPGHRLPKLEQRDEPQHQQRRGGRARNDRTGSTMARRNHRDSEPVRLAPSRCGRRHCRLRAGAAQVSSR